MRPRVGRVLVFAAAVALAWALAAAPPAFAQSYSMTRVDIEAVVQRDGSMLVTETRTFDFDGGFTFAYWELDKSAPADAGSDVTVTVIGMSSPEGGTRSQAIPRHEIRGLRARIR